MLEWIFPHFTNGKLRHRCAAVQLLLLVATLSACTRQDPNETANRLARQAEQDRDRELSQIRLDPADCPGGGDGMIYVALGDVVVRVPYSKEHPLGRNPVYSGGEKLPTPPMPDTPEGCKEHPARAVALHLWSVIAQSRDHVAAPLTAISLFWTDTGRSPNQEMNERQFDRIRAQVKCTTSQSGLTTCGWQAKGLPAATGLQVAGGDVAGGPRWVASCGQGPSILVDDCIVYYQLRKGMVVSYQFKQQQVSLDRMFELDPSIRSWISSLVVENYPWP